MVAQLTPVLNGLHVAVLANDMVEESEVIETCQALEEAGAVTQLISTKPGEIISATGSHRSDRYRVDATFYDIESHQFDAVLIPGGVYNADSLRVDLRAQDFVREMEGAGKPIAVTGHGAWLLVSAGLVEGRHLTSHYTIADDVRNAGGEWTNEPVVVDSNWVSSRKADDLPEFVEAMVNLFAEALETTLV